MINSNMNQFKHLIIIGGQRCGTTFAINLLKKINKFKLTKTILPEPKYFLKEKFIYKEYLDSFFRYTINNKNQIFVEKSTTYYERPIAIKNICNNINDYQILLFIRDPIKRAISNYFFSKNNGFEKLDINQAFEREIYKSFPKNKNFGLSTDPLDYISRGKYSELINDFIRYIPRNKFNIFPFERLTTNPKAFVNFLSILYNSPEINTDFNTIKKSDLYIKVNDSKFSSNQILKEEIICELKKIYINEKTFLEDKFSVDLSLWQI